MRHSREIRELRALVLAQEERRQLAAERERRKRLVVEDTLAEIRDLKKYQAPDNMSRLVAALQEWINE